MKKLFIAILVAGTAMSAFAGSSFSSSRSFSSPARSYSSYGSFRSNASSVRTVTPRPVTIQKNVTVQQNVTHVTQHTSSGGGFMSSFLGSMAGSSISNWLFAPKPAAPQPQVDCHLEQNKTLAVCQPAVTQ